jgi:hypothetical protein
MENCKTGKKVAPGFIYLLNSLPDRFIRILSGI